MRRVIFVRNLKDALAHNGAMIHSYKKGINDFSDRTVDEIRAKSRGTILSGNKGAKAIFQAKMDPLTLPNSVDYRNALPPVLTAVKDQGNCGSCWAHATIESIESHYAIKTGELFTLSQQQLVSCVQNPNDCGGTGGCLGATIELGYKQAIATGSASEWTYSYSSYFGEVASCTTNSNVTKPVAKPTGYVLVKSNDQSAVMEALATQGPLAVVVDASNWNTYESGVYSGCNYANNITIDHGVQLVGYGTDAALGKDYWIIRNSWSATFGEQGFIRIERSATPQCGWSVEWTTQGLGCKGDPDQVWVCGQCGVLMETSYPTFD